MTKATKIPGLGPVTFDDDLEQDYTAPMAGSGPSTAPLTVTGSVDWPPQIGFTLPPAVNLDVTFTFAAATGGVPATESLKAQSVDVRSACAQ